jgi:hypothetical protein
MPDEQRGLQPARDIITLEVYLEALGYLKVVNGRLDADTLDATKRFQRDNNLVVDGVAGEKTWIKLFSLRPDLTKQIADKWLSQADIEAVAAQVDLSVPTVRAVYRVESGGSGFWGLRPKILFEGHIFWRQLQARGKNPAALQAGFADVLFPKWDRTKYVGGPGEYPRLEKAQTLDSSAALESASWGLFQILGLHAKPLGYASVEEFVDQMYQNERAQLEAFARFLQKNSFGGKSLAQLLRERDWATFARAYNGPMYAQNQYDKKLRDAYLASGGTP